MAEFPALPFWTDAYLADTRDLTAAQHGAYFLLLMTAWRTKDNGLPDDDEKLARWAAMDRRTWLKNKKVVMAFWCKIDGVWHQKRLDDERKRAEHNRKCQVQAGIASALKRNKTNSRHVITDVPTESQPPSPSPSPSPLISKPNHSYKTETVVVETRANAPRSSTTKKIFIWNGEELDELPEEKTIIALGEGWKLPMKWGEECEKLGFTNGRIMAEIERFHSSFTVGKNAGRAQTIRRWANSWFKWMDIVRQNEEKSQWATTNRKGSSL